MGANNRCMLLTGLRYGRLVVLRHAGQVPAGNKWVSRLRKRKQRDAAENIIFDKRKAA